MSKAPKQQTDAAKTDKRKPFLHSRAGTVFAAERPFITRLQAGGKLPTLQGKFSGYDLNADALVSARYPHIRKVLDDSQIRIIQQHVNFWVRNLVINEKVQDFEQQERKKAERDGYLKIYKHINNYEERLEKISSAGSLEMPEISKIQIDTTKIIDPKILDEQPSNVEAEKAFRERWVLKLASKPTTLNLNSKSSVEEVFVPFWGEGSDVVYLPTAGGLITFECLLELPGASTDYRINVRHSPLVTEVENTLRGLYDLWSNGHDDYLLEIARRDDHYVLPFDILKVSTVTEGLSGSLNLNDIELAMEITVQALQLGKIKGEEFQSFFRSTLKQMERSLPAEKDWDNIMLKMQKLTDLIYTNKQYEFAAMIMPLVTDDLELLLYKTYSYRDRVLGMAGQVITGLNIIRKGCDIALSIAAGARAAKAGLGLVGVSLSSGAGAGASTLMQESAMQIQTGQFDLKKIILKSGKDAVITSISAYIGGSLSSKFQSILSTRLAASGPKASFLINRVADASSGVLTTPVEIVLNRILNDGKWPNSMDEFLSMVADNVAAEMVLGAGIDIAGSSSWRNGKPDDVNTPANPALSPAAASKQAIDAAHTQTANQAGTKSVYVSAPAPGLNVSRIVSETSIIQSIDRTKPISASGDKGSTSAHQAYGAFEARIRIENGQTLDAVVKILPPGKNYHDVFVREVEGAKVAAETGIGPEFYGVTQVKDGYAFAMGKVEGFFPSNLLRPEHPDYAQAEIESRQAIDSLIPEASQDVRNFGDELVKRGYHVNGELQGLIGPDGRWRPIDFSGIQKLPDNPVDRLVAVRDHEGNIEREAEFLDRIITSKQESTGPPQVAAADQIDPIPDGSPYRILDTQMARKKMDAQVPPAPDERVVRTVAYELSEAKKAAANPFAEVPLTDAPGKQKLDSILAELDNVRVGKSGTKDRLIVRQALVVSRHPQTPNTFVTNDSDVYQRMTSFSIAPKFPAPTRDLRFSGRTLQEFLNDKGVKKYLIEIEGYQLYIEPVF